MISGKVVYPNEVLHDTPESKRLLEEDHFCSHLMLGEIYGRKAKPASFLMRRGLRSQIYEAFSETYTGKSDILYFRPAREPVTPIIRPIGTGRTLLAPELIDEVLGEGTWDALCQSTMRVP